MCTYVHIYISVFPLSTGYWSSISPCSTESDLLAYLQFWALYAEKEIICHLFLVLQGQIYDLFYRKMRNKCYLWPQKRRKVFSSFVSIFAAQQLPKIAYLYSTRYVWLEKFISVRTVQVTGVLSQLFNLFHSLNKHPPYSKFLICLSVRGRPGLPETLCFFQTKFTTQKIWKVFFTYTYVIRIRT